MIAIEKKKVTIVEVLENNQNTDLNKNNLFIENYETALLLSLLEKRLLTQVQFERCMEELMKLRIIKV